MNYNFFLAPSFHFPVNSDHPTGPVLPTLLRKCRSLHKEEIFVIYWGDGQTRGVRYDGFEERVSVNVKLYCCGPELIHFCCPEHVSSQPVEGKRLIHKAECALCSITTRQAEKDYTWNVIKTAGS